MHKDERVEKVSRAIFAADWPNDNWERLGSGGYHQTRYANMARAALSALVEEQPVAALAVQTQQGVEVKKLEWDGFGRAHSEVGTYEVVCIAQGGVFGLWRPIDDGSTFPNYEGSEEHCRAAAQSDYETRIRSAIVDVPAVEPEPVAWCQPDYGGKIHPRKFMVVYEDAEMGNAVFDDEAEAREHFEKASVTWNCYLFGLLPRTSPVRSAIAPAPAEVVVPRERLLKLLGYADANYVPNSIFAEFRGYLTALSPSLVHAEDGMAHGSTSTSSGTGGGE